MVLRPKVVVCRFNRLGRLPELKMIPGVKLVLLLIISMCVRVRVSVLSRLKILQIGLMRYRVKVLVGGGVIACCLLWGIMYRVRLPLISFRSRKVIVGSGMERSLGSVASAVMVLWILQGFCPIVRRRLCVFVVVVVCGFVAAVEASGVVGELVAVEGSAHSVLAIGLADAV